jgi:hypothetical protein
MRFVLMAASVLALAACGEQQSTPEASAVQTPASTTPTVGIPGDANRLSPAEIASLLVGEFRSTQDEKNTISVTSDGRWVEAYEGGGPPSTSSWQVFPGDQPPAGASGSFTAASRYLELKSDNEVFYYEMGTVSGDGFDMFATRRGNMLDFARIKAPA